MFVVEIAWQVAATTTKEQVEDGIYWMLAFWRRNGQIADEDYLFARNDDRILAYATIPELDALDEKYNNKYVREGLQTAAKWGISRPTVRIIGRSPDENPCNCGKTDSYILQSHYLTTDSPIRCGGCFGRIPLYRLPKTYHDNEEYFDLLMWAKDYRACDTLQMHCTTGERFGIRQMSLPDSSLSKEGRKIADRLTELTGKPAYYSLYRYHRRTTVAKERERRCPGCGGEWLLPEKWHYFDFRCDRCRLVSQISCAI
jgi:predicted  nucleic acid-binding Zn ribbon protein